MQIYGSQQRLALAFAGLVVFGAMVRYAVKRD